ncbi:MAG: 23S rRNA (guanosine(2251)-2'-O)-methyltransferase RlmB [Bacteroidales bacterium]|nr:23S rRNA (guanosine(2251)-2'-O)-methyltransferase RlmB [Bacteroidales bacterium]
MEKTNSRQQTIYGLRPVIEALDGDTHIDRVLMLRDLSGPLAGELRAKIKAAGVPVQYVPAERLARLAAGNHQGVVATIAPVRYRDFTEFLEESASNALIVLLDHVTDVRNMGAIARTAECAGATALVVPDHGSAAINDDAVKTSSGALLRLPVCREQNLKTVVNVARQYGLQVVAATEKAAQLYTELDLRQPTLLIMGAEENGISPELLRMADHRAKLPMMGQVKSLNVSVAAGIFLYEALRQRGTEG